MKYIGGQIKQPVSLSWGQTLLGAGVHPSFHPCCPAMLGFAVLPASTVPVAIRAT
jgi:hypothetical protein